MDLISFSFSLCKIVLLVLGSNVIWAYFHMIHIRRYRNCVRWKTHSPMFLKGCLKHNFLSQNLPLFPYQQLSAVRFSYVSVFLNTVCTFIYWRADMRARFLHNTFVSFLEARRMKEQSCRMAFTQYGWSARAGMIYKSIAGLVHADS